MAECLPVLEQIRQCNKHNWLCVKFTNKQIYYGETTREEGQEEAPLLRHGLGVQFYQVDLEQHDEAQQSKYEGHWKKDQREGQGRVEYMDGSVYEGLFKNNQREGEGQMRFANGWVYKGMWKNNKMEGKGTLTDTEGNSKQRVMKKNFVLEDTAQGIFAWPFYTQAQLQEYMAAKKQRLFDQEQNKTQSYFYIEKTRDYSTAAFKVNESEQHSRTPLLLLAQDRTEHKDEVVDKLRRQLKVDKAIEVDLRKLDHLQGDRKALGEYRQELKEDLAEAMSEGHLVVINLDDNTDLPQNNGYPDLREYYSQDSLPFQIWERQNLERVAKRVYKGTAFEDTLGVHPRFRVIVWSGFRLNGRDNKKKIVEVFDKRFSQLLPLEHIDLILLLA